MGIPLGTSETKNGNKLRQASGILATAMALSPLALVTAGGTANAAETTPTELTVLAGNEVQVNLLTYFSFMSGPVNLNVYAQNTVNHTTYSMSGTTLTFAGYDEHWDNPVLSHNKSANTTTFMVNDPSTSDWYPLNVRVIAEPFQKLQIPNQNIAKGGTLSIPFASIFGDEDDDFNELTMTGYLTGMIPTGVTSSISGGNFIISADSSATGTFSVYVSARDSDDQTVSETFSVTIADPPATPLTSIGGKSFTLDMDEEIDVWANELFSGGTGSISIVDTYIEDDNFAYVSVYPGSASHDLLAIGPFFRGHAGTSTVTIVAQDSGGWARFGSFSVSVAPAVEFYDVEMDEERDIFEVQLNSEAPGVLLKLNQSGTAYLAPSTAEILSASDLDALVTAGKAVKQEMIYDPEAENYFLPIDIDLPMNKTYTAYLVYSDGANRYVAAPSKMRAFVSYDLSSFFMNLLGDDYQLNIGDIVKFAVAHPGDFDVRDLKYFLRYIFPFQMPE